MTYSGQDLNANLQEITVNSQLTLYYLDVNSLLQFSVYSIYVVTVLGPQNQFWVCLTIVL